MTRCWKRYVQTVRCARYCKEGKMKIELENCRKCIHSSVCTWYGAEYCDWYVDTCGDAISRQAVLDAFWKLNVELSPTAIWTIQNMVKDVPSVTPQQRTGRWIKQNYGWNWQCSECGFVTPPSAKEIFTFCPNCGAKMEAENAD